MDELPDGVDAIIVTSDLQGVVPPGWRAKEGALLGVELACEMRALAEDGELPYPERTGVVLAGDLYSAPAANKRGATGDVRAVWLAWAERHRWVCGVQGNHDLFGDSRKDRTRFEETEDVHLLDGDVRELDGIRFGGVGKIIGDPKKKGRKSETEFLGGLERVARAEPDVIVLHQGPDASRRQRGDERVRRTLEKTAAEAHDLRPRPLGRRSGRDALGTGAERRRASRRALRVDFYTKPRKPFSAT